MPNKKIYVYWNPETSEIYSIFPKKIENPKTDNPPLEISLQEGLEFLSGTKKFHDYHIGSSDNKNTLVIKKKTRDFNLNIKTAATRNKLIEIEEKGLEADIILTWDLEDKKLKIKLNKDTSLSTYSLMNFYITKFEDPYHFIGEIKIQLSDLIHAKKQEIEKKIDTNEDISVYTILLFESYSLERINGQDKYNRI